MFGKNRSPERNDKSVILRTSSESELAAHLNILKMQPTSLDRSLLTALWQEAAIRLYYLWYAPWLGFSRPQNRSELSLRQRLGKVKRAIQNVLIPTEFNKSPLPRERLLLWYHLFACENHRDAIATALGVLGGEIEDLRTEEIRRVVDEMMPWSILEEGQ
jgi:hypothetical protein